MTGHAQVVELLLSHKINRQSWPRRGRIFNVTKVPATTKTAEPRLEVLLGVGVVVAIAVAAYVVNVLSDVA